MAALEVRSAERILNKALELFSTKGYDATSVREICEAADITKPTLYHFYGSKEGVYRALVEGALEGFRERLLAQIETPRDAARATERVARSYFEAAREHRELMRFLFALVHNPPSSAPRTDFSSYYEGVVSPISRVVEDGVARPDLRPGAHRHAHAGVHGGPRRSPLWLAHRGHAPTSRPSSPTPWSTPFSGGWSPSPNASL